MVYGLTYDHLDTKGGLGVLWSKLWRMIMFDAKDLDKIWYG